MQSKLLNRIRIQSTIVVAGLFGGVLFMPAASADDLRGYVDWPEEWVVFAPMGDAAPELPAEVLAGIPARLESAAGEAILPRQLMAEPGSRIDLKEFFDEPKIGNTAWLFAAIDSEEEQTVSIGMGADWWFTAWINGAQVLASPKQGNGTWPPTAADFTADVTLRKGTNILAVRFESGSASAYFNAGGPREIRAARQPQDEHTNPLHFNTARPFPEIAPFPLETQATAAAELDLEFPDPPENFRRGEIAGLRPLPKRQLHFTEWEGRPWVLDTEGRRAQEQPLEILPARRYSPAEDGHVDLLVWTKPPPGVLNAGTLEVLMKDAAGKVLARQEIGEIAPAGWFFSMGFPDSMVGREGEIEVIWRQDGRELARAGAPFGVLPPTGVAQAGRIPVEVANPDRVTVSNLPFTVGLPFPNGALHDQQRVRLVDENGIEIALQTKIVGRWSRFGPVKWLLCDFTLDLAAEPRQLVFEYGPRISRRQLPPMAVTVHPTGFPTVDAGRIVAGPEGLSFSAEGRPGPHAGAGRPGFFRALLDRLTGTARQETVEAPRLSPALPVLAPDALRGGFVQDEAGTVFRIPPGAEFALEEQGSEKSVVRAAGWYVAEDGTRFCNYVTRFEFFRQSPLLRIYHTWIFTGDGNRDRIRDMGWEFPAAGEFTPMGFLSGASEWLDGRRLLQFDHSKFEIDGDGQDRDGRMPGVLAGSVGATGLVFGAKDFWQNFPSEIDATGAGFAFFNWPRHNRPATTESPVPAGKAFQLRYAHEGQLLDFRTPPEYLDGDIWLGSSNNGSDPVWRKGDVEGINAQGVARTEELLLLFHPGSDAKPAEAQVLAGLDAGSLRAVVDPAWIAATGAMGEIHQRDPERFPREEALFELIAKAPGKWNERLDSYGMWISGDFPVDSADLRNQTASPRRTFKKGHHGWPYKWVPYARSGDPELFKLAEAGTRRMVDSGFKHYADPDVQSRVHSGAVPATGQGWTGTSLFPWYGSTLRSISQDVDYLWHSYYLTGYQRAKDVALLWAELTQRDTSVPHPGRISVSMLHYFLETYHATFDPWFLIAAQAIAEWHRAIWGDGEVDPLTTSTVGHFWKPGDYEFFRFTNNERYRPVAELIATSWPSPWTHTEAWQRLDVPMIEESAAAWRLTGDDFYLRRVEGFLDSANIQVFDAGEPEFLRGSNVRHGGVGTALELFTGWYIQQFPVGLRALVDSGSRYEPVGQPFFQRPVAEETVRVGDSEFHRVRPPEVLFRKPSEAALPFLLDTWRYAEVPFQYRVTGPDGQTALEGEWLSNQRLRVEIPAGTPPGLYRIVVEGLDPNTGWKAPGSQFEVGLQQMPVLPPDVPEVMALERSEEGTPVGPAVFESQYWFYVPEEATQFWIKLPGKQGKIWNPDGEVVWDAWRLPDNERALAEVPVAENHRGKLWRFTAPGGRPGIVFDPQIPPYFSATRAKWFDPGTDGQPPQLAPAPTAR